MKEEYIKLANIDFININHLYKEVIKFLNLSEDFQAVEAVETLKEFIYINNDIKEFIIRQIPYEISSDYFSLILPIKLLKFNNGDKLCSFVNNLSNVERVQNPLSIDFKLYPLFSPDFKKSNYKYTEDFKKLDFIHIQFEYFKNLNEFKSSFKPIHEYNIKNEKYLEFEELILEKLNKSDPNYHLVINKINKLRSQIESLHTNAKKLEEEEKVVKYKYRETFEHLKIEKKKVSSYYPSNFFTESFNVKKEKEEDKRSFTNFMKSIEDFSDDAGNIVNFNELENRIVQNDSDFEILIQPLQEDNF